MIKIKEQNRHMKHIRRDVLLFGHYDMSLDEFINVFCVKVGGKLIAWDDLGEAKRYILSKWDIDASIEVTEYGKRRNVEGKAIYTEIDRESSKYIENTKYYSIRFVPNPVIKHLRDELEWANNFIILINEEIDKYGESNKFIGEIVKYYGMERPGFKLNFWIWLRELCHIHDWCTTVSGKYGGGVNDIEAVFTFRRSNRKKP